ncbi:hypothetical protein C8F01DRAFT_322092 [Mycena amicta]|nr:hypothetical protein C8F01DRAFT_322092 [Mycena amicta]
MKDADECQIAEIPQYSCKRNKKNNQIQCLPVLRLFRICADQVVEVTRVLQIDADTGYVEIPRHLEQKLPQGKPWRDVTTFDANVEDE